MATMTITTTADNAARAVTAYGDLLGLERDATAGELKQHVIREMKQVVRQYEERIVSDAAKATVGDIEPT